MGLVSWFVAASKNWSDGRQNYGELVLKTKILRMLSQNRSERIFISLKMSLKFFLQNIRKISLHRIRLIDTNHTIICNNHIRLFSFRVILYIMSMIPCVCVCVIIGIDLHVKTFEALDQPACIVVWSIKSWSTVKTGSSLAVACWTTDHYHPCSNLGVGRSEGCFVFDYASLPLQVARPI